MTWSKEALPPNSDYYHKSGVGVWMGIEKMPLSRALEMTTGSTKRKEIVRVSSLGEGCRLAVLAVLVTRASQSRQHFGTSLIHKESCKSSTAELFEVDSGRISIRHCASAVVTVEDFDITGVGPGLKLSCSSAIVGHCGTGSELTLSDTIRGNSSSKRFSVKHVVAIASAQKIKGTLAALSVGIKRLLSDVEVTAASYEITTAVNGDSPPPMRTVNGVEQTYPPTTTKEKLARKNKLKARGTLLMALLNEHQLKFNSYKNAKSLMDEVWR
uniref:Uncharacterized protein n=1 Tax=Tanacetum cinerariifolium TaxID=118510 RepID=A0A699I5E9_TANCI|nr:hypothetical protein [Tanacetum cinerariifolium]